LSSDLQYRAFWQLFTRVLEKIAAYIFRPEAMRLGSTSGRNSSCLKSESSEEYTKTYEKGSSKGRTGKGGQ
jgi:hypothetical protein